MRKAISLSALLSSLLATHPMYAENPGNAKRPEEPPLVIPDGNETTAPAHPAGEPPFPGNMPANVRQQLEAAAAQNEANIQRMRDINQRMQQQVQEHMARAIAQMDNGQPVQIQLQPNEGPGNFPGWNLPGINTVAVSTHLEKLAFLGVTTSPVPALVREQLKLPRGFGLVVDFVEKDSPAAAAGIKIHDILQKIDDQQLVNPEQLATLVHAKAAGDSVAVTVLREGKPVTLTAKLAEKEMPVPDDDNVRLMPRGRIGFPGAAPQLAPVPPRTGAVNVDVLTPRPDADWHQGLSRTVVANTDGSTTRTQNDDTSTITLTTKDNASTLAIKDNAGKEIFSGPYTTDEDKKKVPADYTDKVQALQNTAAHVTITSNGQTVASESLQVGRADGVHKMTLTLNGAGKHLLVQDKDNKTLFDGPANTEDDLKPLPDDVRTKLKALEAKIHVR